MRTTLTIDDDITAILRRLARARNARRKDLVKETVEHGLILCSTDGDLARFSALRRENPLPS